MSIRLSRRSALLASGGAAATLAAHLHAQGIGKGDRVALAMRNLPEWPVAFFAITAIGAICVPLNAWWSAGELAFGIADSGARLVICDGERHARIGACDVPMLVASSPWHLTRGVLATVFSLLLPVGQSEGPMRSSIAP